MREVDGQDVWSKIKIRQSRTYVHHDGGEWRERSGGDDDVKKGIKQMACFISFLIMFSNVVNETCVVCNWLWT